MLFDSPCLSDGTEYVTPPPFWRRVFDSDCKCERLNQPFGFGVQVVSPLQLKLSTDSCRAIYRAFHVSIGDIQLFTQKVFW